MARFLRSLLTSKNNPDMSLKKTTILNLSGAVTAALSAGRLSQALSNLEGFARAASAPYNIISRITALSESYSMLSRFLIDGVADPHRGEIAADIAAESAAICAAIERQSLQDSDESTLYFSTLRFENTRADESISHLLQTYNRAAADPSTPKATLESMATRLFNRVWITYPLQPSDAEVLHSAVAAGTLRLPSHTRVQLIGALLLGSLQYFDERRAVILADTYRINHTTPLGAIALTALILALASAPSYTTGSRRLTSALRALADLPDPGADLRMAFMQLIRSRDTERVRRKMTDELIPGLMKLRPDINRKISDLSKTEANPFDEDGGLNPEWEDLFEKSGLGDKLRELNDLQSEGADVMMATMGNLKDFAFFNDPANWFLPFYAAHSAAAASGVEQLAQSIEDLPMMCDGDKYSLVLLASRMGGNMMGPSISAQIREQQKQWQELRATDLNAEQRSRSDAANSFVQNVYRFFKLFRRKGEFNDPFIRPINPLTTPFLRDEMGSDAEGLSVASEFYFRRGHHEEALQLFSRIEELARPSAELFQKKGYLLEMTGHPDEALKAYHTADLIDSESVWTLRRIATLLRKSGQYTEALAVFDRIEALKPDRRADIMARADTLMQLHRYSDALALLYKADYLKPDHTDTLRMMTMCQLITGEHEKALSTAMRLRTLSPDNDPDTAYDHIMRGHAMLALKDLKGAVEAYSDYIAASEFNTSSFFKCIDADRSIMERLGADQLTINIITEAAADSASKRGTKLDR